MKKLLLLAGCAVSMGAMAQQWVATTPQPKNVILEEFTGINCSFCPDGHRIANDLVKGNPNRVFLINIHAGSFASPGAGQPDFRTAAGTAIDGAAGVTGYPSGSVNRSTTPWGQSRSAWTNLASGILSQTSPVNVAVKASVNMATRTITTEVEVYYTGNEANAKNFLTVALTQDDILGPQADNGNYFPENWVNGQYRHNHVLRQLITPGNFGEQLDTTTSGKYYYRKYTTIIPENYINTKANLTKMNVVAFVAQNNSNILSGVEAPVTFDDALKTDLKVTDLTVKPNMCGTSVTPTVEVTNMMDNFITSFNIAATVNGITYNKTVTPNEALARNAKVTVTWDPINLTNGGAYSVSIGGIDNVKGATNQTLYDIDMNNDGASFGGLTFKAATVNNKNIWCGFESITNTAFDFSENDNATVPTTGSYGAWSTRALRVSLHQSWGGAGKPVHVLFGKSDLSAISNPGIGFFYAYSDGSEGGTAPTVAVSVSKDCGATWNVVKTITAVETGQPTTAGNWYVPAMNGHYKFEKVDLDAYKSENIIARISVTPGTTGNAFYLDELSISSMGSLGVKENTESLAFEVYPNPSNGIVNIALPEFKGGSYIVRDVTGKEVIASTLTSNETAIDCSALTNGVYFVEVEANGSKTTQKFILSR
jgi:hypothetical protein